jgi:hypothetical protein
MMVEPLLLRFGSVSDVDPVSTIEHMVTEQHLLSQKPEVFRASFCPFGHIESSVTDQLTAFIKGGNAVMFKPQRPDVMAGSLRVYLVKELHDSPF